MLQTLPIRGMLHLRPQARLPMRLAPKLIQNLSQISRAATRRPLPSIAPDSQIVLSSRGPRIRRA